MKKGFVLLLFQIVLFQSAATMAATEFEDNIPLDLAKIFLNPGSFPTVGIYKDIVDDFPAFDIPDGFTVLGSLDQGFMQRVVLETQIDRGEAGIQIYNKLAENGWIELPLPDAISQTQRGFVPSGGRTSFETGLTFCHDELGNLSLTVQDKEDSKLVSLSRTNTAMFNGIQLGCDAQIESMQRGFDRGMMRNGVREHMPIVRMPAEQNPAPSMRGFYRGGGGGSPTEWESRANLLIDWELARLYQYFEEQIQEQEWVKDSAWAGEISAGGTWTKSSENDPDLVVILTIVKVGEENVDMKLRIFSATGGQNAAGIGGFDTIIGQ